MQRVADDFQRFADSAGDLLSRERRRLYEQLLKSAPRLLQRYHSHQNFTITQGDAQFEHFLAERSPVRRCAPLRLGCLEARGRVARPCLHDRDALVSRPSKRDGKLSPRLISRHACCSRSSGRRPTRAGSGLSLVGTLANYDACMAGCAQYPCRNLVEQS